MLMHIFALVFVPGFQTAFADAVGGASGGAAAASPNAEEVQIIGSANVEKTLLDTAVAVDMAIKPSEPTEDDNLGTKKNYSGEEVEKRGELQAPGVGEEGRAADRNVSGEEEKDAGDARAKPIATAKAAETNASASHQPPQQQTPPVKVVPPVLSSTPIETPDDTRVNYASKSSGSIVLDSTDVFKYVGHVLNDDSNEYALVPCATRKKYITISLGQDALVDTVSLHNNEAYSGTLTDVQVLGSAKYPTKQWMLMGEIHVENDNNMQAFKLPRPAWVQFLKFRFRSHHGDEFYCTLTNIKVNGESMMDAMQKTLDEADLIGGEQEKPLGQESTKPNSPMGGSEYDDGGGKQAKSVSSEVADHADAQVQGHPERSSHGEGASTGQPLELAEDRITDEQKQQALKDNKQQALKEMEEKVAAAEAAAEAAGGASEDGEGSEADGELREAKSPTGEGMEMDLAGGDPVTMELNPDGELDKCIDESTQAEEGQAFAHSESEGSQEDRESQDSGAGATEETPAIPSQPAQEKGEDQPSASVNKHVPVDNSHGVEQRAGAEAGDGSPPASKKQTAPPSNDGGAGANLDQIKNVPQPKGLEEGSSIAKGAPSIGEHDKPASKTVAANSPRELKQAKGLEHAKTTAAIEMGSVGDSTDVPKAAAEDTAKAAAKMDTGKLRSSVPRNMSVNLPNITISDVEEKQKQGRNTSSANGPNGANGAGAASAPSPPTSTSGSKPQKKDKAAGGKPSRASSKYKGAASSNSGSVNTLKNKEKLSMSERLKMFEGILPRPPPSSDKKKIDLPRSGAKIENIFTTLTAKLKSVSEDEFQLRHHLTDTIVGYNVILSSLHQKNLENKEQLRVLSERAEQAEKTAESVLQEIENIHTAIMVLMVGLFLSFLIHVYYARRRSVDSELFMSLYDDDIGDGEQGDV